MPLEKLRRNHFQTITIITSRSNIFRINKIIRRPVLGVIPALRPIRASRAVQLTPTFNRFNFPLYNFYVNPLLQFPFFTHTGNVVNGLFILWDPP